MSSDDDGAISEAYKAYKLSTNYVLLWLQSQYQLHVPGNAASFTSTNDILKAVRVLQEKKIGVPSSVIASLRNAIAKRREVAAIYQGLGTNDLEHEVFLESKVLEFLLEDDALGMLVQIVKFIYEYDALQSQLKEYSADAARGFVPLPLAATLMSLALHFFMNCLPPFLANDSPKFHALWREAHHLHVKLPQFTASLVKRDGPISGPARIRNLGETIRSFESFRRFVTAKEARGLHRIVDIVHLLPYRRPEARFSAVEPGQSMRDPSEEETVLDVLMTIEDMIAETPRTPKPKDSVPRSFNRLDTYTPIRLAAEEFLNDRSLPPKTGLVMGMDLFLSTYEGFLWADERLNVQSCHELAVRLSKDMQVGILPVVTIVEAMIQQDHLDGEKTFLEELQGPYPVARVNYFAIFVLCARILGDFSRQIHPSTYRNLRSTGNPKSPAIKAFEMFPEEDDSFAETYLLYKISTDYFLDWLWSQHEDLFSKPASVPRTTKGMLTAAKALAQTLKRNKQRIPTDVINSLRDAISKRREALAVYEELGADDENHEIFIQRSDLIISQSI
ncbi:hypothetical protein KHU50_006322 [Colletotrichum sp. SAR 10_65]|nr:hypothetical protein KHU50_006322 [Colletotrichum sp. SAR 10_65]KAI8261217.1 hypothetical protein K4K53_000923 [Colletotrichum sp. SAR 10_77]